MLAGVFPEELVEGSDLKKLAESTYITNLRIAAEECAKVDICNPVTRPLSSFPGAQESVGMRLSHPHAVKSSCTK